MTDLSKVALEIARFFLRHLVEELDKPSAVMDDGRFDGRSPRAANEAFIARLRAAFPALASLPQPPSNFIRTWVERNRFLHGYDGYAYVAYNTIFTERILCLHEWSPEARKRFHDVALDTFRKIDVGMAGFSVSFFLRVENNMRELLREILHGVPGVDQDAAWATLYQQSSEYQESINEFFEQKLQAAYDESERLLQSILPPSICLELKRTGKVQPVLVPDATVLFTDFVGFTQLSERMSPAELVGELDACFRVFDGIIAELGLEKIKTIGDAYMCVAGAPEPRPSHAVDAARAAIRMRDAIAVRKREREAEGRPYWDVRVGFHSGPLVAGVIGTRKFSYDVWGDTVNTASRMESSGVPGKINVSAAAAERLGERFVLAPRGRVAAKGKGELEMFFLEGERS